MIFNFFCRDKKPVHFIRRWVIILLFTSGFLGSIEESLAQTQVVDIGQNTSSNNLKENEIILGDTSTNILVTSIGYSAPSYRNGGVKGLIDFVKKNLENSIDSTKGKVLVKLSIDKSGKVIDEIIIRGLSESVNSKVLNLVKLLEFSPGKLDVENVQFDCYFNLIFKFEN